MKLTAKEALFLTALVREQNQATPTAPMLRVAVRQPLMEDGLLDRMTGSPNAVTASSRIPTYSAPAAEILPDLC